MLGDETTITIEPLEVRGLQNGHEDGVTESQALLITDAANQTTYRKVLLETLKVALPITANGFILFAGNFGCIVMLGKLGSSELAAGATITTIQSTILSIGTAFQTSIDPLISAAFASEQYRLVGSITQQGCMVGLMASIPLVALSYVIKPILLGLHQPDEVASISQEFFNIFAWSIPSQLMLNCLIQVACSMGKQNSTVILSIYRSLINLGFSYLLIFAADDNLNLGAKGVAYANLIQAWTSFVFFGLYFALGKDFRLFEIFKPRCRSTFSEFKIILKVAAPVVIQVTGVISATFALTSIVGLKGIEALAAYNIVLQYVLFGLIPLFSLSTSMSILIGRAFNKRQLSELKRLGIAGLMLGIGISASALIVFSSAPELLISIFTSDAMENDKQIVSLAKPLFIISGVGLVCSAVKETSAGNLRGLLDTKIPALISIAEIWLISVPLAYLLGIYFDLNVSGVAIAEVAGLLMAAGLMWNRWRKASNNPEKYARFEQAEAENEEPSCWTRCTRRAYRTFSSITFFSRSTGVNSEQNNDINHELDNPRNSSGQQLLSATV